jgi:beta-fructofuranosidase
MSLHLPDKWVWDFWFARQGEYTHIFYLQAPRRLKDPEIRHWNASIGHARSLDLKNWEILPDALHPSANEKEWDSQATWTGSVIEHAGSWYMFYTGISKIDGGLTQRIGLAKTTDLVHWEKYTNNPLIHIDEKRYEILNKKIWYEGTWRDPWVFELDGVFHALITARVPYGEPLSRGVVAHAVSQDLHDWKVEEPLTEAGEFAYLEVPQVARIGAHWYLFFSVEKSRFSQQRSARKGMRPQTGTHYLIGENPLGPYRLLTDDFLCGDEQGSFYSGKVIENKAGDWVFMASRQYKDSSEYIGEICDPLPIEAQADGRLVIKNGCGGSSS